LQPAEDWRIREDVLERDYCLAWFLNALAESDLRPVLAFKGGTALKRRYWNPTPSCKASRNEIFVNQGKGVASEGSHVTKDA